MVVSIVVFAVVRWPAWYWLVLSRVILIPLIAGISYEIDEWAGRHETSRFVRVIMAPGLALQWMTTKQPDRAQIEVAVSALPARHRARAPGRAARRGRRGHGVRAALVTSEAAVTA